jgi:hypothetical protein
MMLADVLGAWEISGRGNRQVVGSNPTRPTASTSTNAGLSRLDLGCPYRSRTSWVGSVTRVSCLRNRVLVAKAVASGPQHSTGLRGSRVSGVSMPRMRTFDLGAAGIGDVRGVAVDDVGHGHRQTVRRGRCDAGRNRHEPHGVAGAARRRGSVVGRPPVRRSRSSCRPWTGPCSSSFSPRADLELDRTVLRAVRNCLV